MIGEISFKSYISTCSRRYFPSWGTWLAQLEDHAILTAGIVNSSHTLDVEHFKKNKILKSNSFLKRAFSTLRHRVNKFYFFRAQENGKVENQRTLEGSLDLTPPDTPIRYSLRLLSQIKRWRSTWLLISQRQPKGIKIEKQNQPWNSNRIKCMSRHYL